MASPPDVTWTVTVRNEGGLHARPAVLVAQAVRTFEARLSLVFDHQRADGTEVLQIMTLGAGPGTEVRLEASGREAQ